MTTLSVIAQHAKKIQPILDSFKKTTDFIEKFKRDNNQIATWYEDVIRGYLAQRGWFVAGSLYTNQFPALKNAIEQNAESEIEDFMIRHVRAISDHAASEASAKWPHRQVILSDAFDAHSKELFTLSVPVMLAQADGIALEILGAFLFTDHSGRVADKAVEIIDVKIKHRPLAKSFLGLLIDASGLRLSTKERDQRKNAGFPVSPLNRHGVLHGIDCDYPTESNSLRAIALIHYLNWVHEITLKKNVS